MMYYLIMFDDVIISGFGFITPKIKSANLCKSIHDRNYMNTKGSSKEGRIKLLKS